MPRLRTLFPSGFPLLLLFAAIFTLAGCKAFYNPYKPQGLTGTEFQGAGGSAVLLPSGNYYLMTVRGQPGQGNTGILCSEPSPDFATATGTSFGTTASGSAPSGPSGSLSVTDSSTETITALLGRTAGVVALRDGLYSACQAYANGIIGRDAYALILSQYGNLLDNIVNGGSAAASGTPTTSGAATTSPSGTATPTGVAVAVATSQGTSATPASSAAPKPGGGNAGSAGSTSSPANLQIAVLQQQAVQALLVACIADADPSVASSKPASPEAQMPNPLLNSVCSGLLSSVAQKIPDLLTPVIVATPANNGAGNGSKPGGASTGWAAIMQLQKILIADGDYTGKVDGIYGPATQAASAAYASKHPGKPAPA